MSQNIKNMREHNILTPEELLINCKLESKSNRVFINGIIENDFKYSHECHGKRFYKTEIKVLRLSGIEDLIPIVVSELQLLHFLNHSIKGEVVQIAGEYRSYNTIGEDNKNHVYLYVLVRSIDFGLIENANLNEIYLDGYVCRRPIFRVTPLGRKITDLIIAVNTTLYRSDYIPCIAWGRIAELAEMLEIGSRIILKGRIQSREYLKRYFSDSDDGEWKVTYEVSITNMENY